MSKFMSGLSKIENVVKKITGKEKWWEPPDKSLAELSAQNDTFAKSINALSLTNLQQIYVSKSGNDTTGDGTSSKPYLTLAKSTSLLMSNYRPKEIIINGDYSDEQLTINGVQGISVRATGTNDAKVKAIYFTNYIATLLFFANLNVTDSTTSGGALACITTGYNYSSRDSYLHMDNCTCGKSGATAIAIQGDINARISNCVINNSAVALQAARTAHVIAQNITGEGNSQAYNATYGGYIKSIGSKPAGYNYQGNDGIIE